MKSTLASCARAEDAELGFPRVKLHLGIGLVLCLRFMTAVHALGSKDLRFAFRVVVFFIWSYVQLGIHLIEMPSIANCTQSHCLSVAQVCSTRSNCKFE